MSTQIRPHGTLRWLGRPRSEGPRPPAPATRHEAPAPLSRREALALRRILLAVRGTSTAGSAVHVAAALARAHGAVLDVVTVFEPTGPEAGARDPLASAVVPPRERGEAERQLATVRDSLRRLEPAAADWPVELAAGHAALRIAEQAAAKRAALVVVGRAPREAGRWHGRTVLDLALASPAPVLSVVGRATPPRHVLLAVALDELAVRAAVAVRRLLPWAHVELVYVRTDPRTSADEIAAHLDRVGLVLRGGDGAPVRRTVIEGPVADALLAHAMRVGADCVAMGLPVASHDQREFAPSAVLHLLEWAPLPVLLAPG